jgi:hypothetical protein
MAAKQNWFTNFASSCKRRLGLDGAVAFTSSARLVNIVGSSGTVLLIVRFLSPVEQGYYYTLLSLVALQVVFELGFSFVIQQLAAHECVHLELLSDGAVTGNPVAHSRLASTLQLSFRWYTGAAFGMALILAPLGALFFARNAAGVTHVAWQGPWLAAVLSSALSLWCMPFYSFLEGCGQVREVARMRLHQAIASALSAWVAMLLHHGLYSPAFVIAGQIGIGLYFLFTNRRLLRGLLRHPVEQGVVRWGREVWPFQWRIAVSWLCSYFAMQVFIPILFALRGPVEAGQMGMSLSITWYMMALVIPWISTKATPFGRMIAERNFHGLDRLFLRTMAQALSAFAVIAIAACIGVAVLPAFSSRLAVRLVSPTLFGVLVLAAAANCIVQSLAILLRSFKSEPFLSQSLVAATITLLAGTAAATRWGNTGAAVSYFAVSACVGLPIALVIFLRARRKYLAKSLVVAN